METLNRRKLILTYMGRGFLIGLLFPAIAVFIEVASLDKDSFWETIEYTYTHNNLQFLALAMPFVVMLIAYIYASGLAKNAKEAQRAYEEEVTKNKKIFSFVEQLRGGAIDAEYELWGAEDELGQSLINLRNKLKENREEENRRKNEDRQRTWVTEGVAKFSDYLRETDNIQELSYLIISKLVKYLDVTQGGFYVIKTNNNGDKYFELTGSYAYDRKKYCDQRIEWGEGLIGACAIERQTIVIDQVTDGYVFVTSGLGKATPKSLLIVPMLINTEIHGILEFAAFKSFAPYQVEFVEKIAESIASTLANIKINERTAALLAESRDSAKILAKQEEEMRKNMEELQEIQLEKAKQSEQFISFTNSVNHTLIRAEYSTAGTLLYANTNFLEKLEYSSNSEVEGKHISMFINKKDREWFNPIWENLAAGGRHFEGDMKHVTKRGHDLWTMATYTCVRKPDGGVEKILFIAIDTTEQKKESLDYKGQIDALNSATIKAEFQVDGKLLNANDKFMQIIDFIPSEIEGKSIFSFIEVDEKAGFKKIWENVVKRITFHGRLKLTSKNGGIVYLRTTFAAVNNMYGEVAKIILIAFDITKQVEVEDKSNKQTQILKMQEEKLQLSQVELSRKLKETREEMKLQFKEIERVKILNEKTLEGMLDAAITINDKSEIIFFNKAAEELWGITKDEVIGQKLKLLLPETDDKDEYLGTYFKVGNTELLNKRTELFLINQAGERVNVLVTISEAKYDKKYNLTAFIQNIELELF